MRKHNRNSEPPILQPTEQNETIFNRKQMRHKQTQHIIYSNRPLSPHPHPTRPDQHIPTPTKGKTLTGSDWASYISQTTPTLHTTFTAIMVFVYRWIRKRLAATMNTLINCILCAGQLWLTSSVCSKLIIWRQFVIFEPTSFRVYVDLRLDAVLKVCEVGASLNWFVD